MRKISPAHPSNMDISTHKFNEHPYNAGIHLETCPQCNKPLPRYAIKQLELGYRVYCPTQGCFYPLFTLSNTQRKAPMPIEPQKVLEKVPHAPKPPQIQQKTPVPSKSSQPPQKVAPPKTSLPPKASELKYCPHCKHPLSETQLKLKQTGKKVMCRKCLELI